MYCALFQVFMPAKELFCTAVLDKIFCFSCSMILFMICPSRLLCYVFLKRNQGKDMLNVQCFFGFNIQILTIFLNY